MKRFGLTALISLVLAASPRAELLQYDDEALFLADLDALGYQLVQEGFEDDAAWGDVRSTISGGFHTAPSVANLGLVWTPNTVNSGVTTGHGPAHTGDWGFYEYPHGDWQNGINDGWVMTGEDTLFALGGWFETNTFGAQISLLLDGVPVVTDVPLDYAHDFVGVIDTGGFESCEVVETEAGGDELLYIFADDFSFGFAAGTGTGDPGTSPSAALRLSVYPNPFNPNTRISFALESAGVVSLQVFDAQGRALRHLVDSEWLSAGTQLRDWDGRDDAGRALPSGIYLLRIQTEFRRAMTKLVLLR